MKRLFAKTAAVFLAAVLLLPVKTQAVSARRAVAMDGLTGRVLFSRKGEEQALIASTTKIMTALIVCEQYNVLSQMRIPKEAVGIEGSSMYLQAGEVLTLQELLYGLMLSSGNDAAVALAIYCGGTVPGFVEMMNEKAVKIGLAGTHFEDCCGLTDSDNHYSCARDVAIMSRELTEKYPEVFDYTTIWMEDITHETRQGTSTFTLNSTNKLLKQYQYTTGLKTGSTSKAKFCLSATASKDGIDLIAVVMGAPDNKARCNDAQALLTYGFTICKIYSDENKEVLPPLSVQGGVEESVPIKYEGEFRYLDVNGSDLSLVEKVLELPAQIQAPAMEGEQAGRARYLLNGEEIGSVPILYGATVEKADYFDYLKKVFRHFML